MSYKASAPANLMILGEYAVITGNPAVVCALDKRLQVTLTPRNDHSIHIECALGNCVVTVDNLIAKAPFDLTMACLQQFDLPRGCNIQIKSDISPTQGLGSSAALVAALMYVLSQWTQNTVEIGELWQNGIQAIRSLTPQASGADLAASLVGGVLLFKNQPFYVESIYFNEAISVIYSGNKLTTSTALISHAQKKKQSPQFIHALEQVSNELVSEFLVAVEENNWIKAGQKMNAAHGLLHTLGVSNQRLDELVWLLRRSLYGAKISGSGLGDCIIGLGETRANLLPLSLIEQGCQQLDLAISSVGVRNDAH